MRHRLALLPLGVAAIVSLALGSKANAELILPSGFSATSAVPANFQNSTVLSVASDQAGDVVASAGSYLSTVSFDGSPSQSTLFPNTSSYTVIEGLSYGPSGNLFALYMNDLGPSSIVSYDGASFSPVAQSAANQGFARSMAIDQNGNILVSGNYNSVGDPGWISEYSRSGTRLFSDDTAQSPAAVAFDSNNRAFVATYDGRVFEVSSTGGLTAVASAGSQWGGTAAGYVESFAIDQQGDFFLGVNLGQEFGVNSSEILRLKSTGAVDVLAYGVGEIPQDMVFGAGGELYVGSFDPYTQSSVYRISGDFSGSFGAEPPPAVPEPSTLITTGVAGVVVLACAWRRPRRADCPTGKA